MENKASTFKFRDHQVAALAELSEHKVMLVKAPTGSGKSVIFMEDSKKYAQEGSVVVFVASRLKLCQQHYTECDSYLTDVDYVDLMVGSHEPMKFQRKNRRVKVQGTFATTSTEDIKNRYRIAQKAELPLYIWTTYDSLNRVLDSNIPITVVYFDEAHNAVQSDNFVSVKRVADAGLRRYFFTATPLMTSSGSDRSSGMNNTEVYGEHSFEVPFVEMLEKNYIVRPVPHLQLSNADLTNGEDPRADYQAIRETVEYYEERAPHLNHKVLVCMKGTKTIADVVEKSDLCSWATSKGYTILTTDSKNGTFENGKKIRDFNGRLKELGSDPNGKLIILHVAQVSEGIDVRGLTGVSFMRGSVPPVFATQAVGRVVRNAPNKDFGFVTIVMHKDDNPEVNNLLQTLIHSLISNGIPFEYLLNEIDGKGDEEEIIENMLGKVKKAIKDLEINWVHQSILDLLAEKDADDDLDDLGW